MIKYNSILAAMFFILILSAGISSSDQVKNYELAIVNALNNFENKESIENKNNVKIQSTFPVMSKAPVMKSVPVKVDKLAMKDKKVVVKKEVVPIMLDVLDLKDTDILDVLKLIAEKSGLNIVTGRNVKAKVSIYLKNVEVRDALDVILDLQGLTFYEENDIIRIMTE